MRNKNSVRSPSNTNNSQINNSAYLNNTSMTRNKLSPSSNNKNSVFSQNLSQSKINIKVDGSGSNLIAKRIEKNKLKKEPSNHSSSNNTSNRNSLIKKNDQNPFSSNANEYRKKILINKISSKNNISDNSNFEFSNNDSNIYYSNQNESKNFKLKSGDIRDKNNNQSKNENPSENEEEINNYKLKNINSSKIKEKNVNKENYEYDNKNYKNAEKHDHIYYNDKDKVSESNKEKLEKLKNLKLDFNKIKKPHKEEKGINQKKSSNYHYEDEDEEENIIIETNKDEDYYKKDKKNKFSQNQRKRNHSNEGNDSLEIEDNFIKKENRRNNADISSSSDVDINLSRKNTPTLGQRNQTSITNDSKPKTKHLHKRSNSFGGFITEIKNDYKEEMLRDFNPQTLRESEEVAGEKFSFRNNLQEQAEIKYMKKLKEEKNAKKNKNYNNDDLEYDENIDEDNYEFSKNNYKHTSKINNKKDDDPDGIKYIKSKVRNYDEYQIKSDRNKLKYKKDENKYQMEENEGYDFNNKNYTNEKPVFKINLNDLEDENYNEEKIEQINLKMNNKNESKINTKRNKDFERSDTNQYNNRKESDNGIITKTKYF